MQIYLLWGLWGNLMRNIYKIPGWQFNYLSSIQNNSNTLDMAGYELILYLNIWPGCISAYFQFYCYGQEEKRD